MEDGSMTPSGALQPSSGTLPAPVTIPGVTTVAVKVPATTVSVPPGSSPPEEGHILIRVHVPELNVQKCLQFPRDELVWDVKQQCLAALPKELKESFNYGLFCPPVNGKAGKFLDEERRLADYPFNGPVGYLELKYKRRVYKMVNLDEKQLKALHTRANLRRLLDYVANGQVEKVAKMCSKGLDPNFHCPETGETPLTVASCTRNPSRILVALVNGGALLDFRSKDGSTAMHRAVERNSYEAVKTLLDLGASPNYRDSRGLTPLYIAVAGSHHSHGPPPLVNSSTAPHSSSSSSSSSTSSAVSSSPGPPGGGSSHHHHHHHHHHHSNHPNSVPPNNGPADAMLCEALLHDHAVLGAQDLQGWQEVHQACRNGLVQHLEHLLFYGADTEARNASGNTPLHVCAVDNRESCARLLLFRGADPNALNYANQTPYQVAVIAGNLELAEIIRNHRPENVVPFREPPRYNPKRRWSGCPPSSHPPPSSASSYAIADRPDPPQPPLPRTQSDSRLETPSGAAINVSVSRARHPPPPSASIPVSSVATSNNAAGTHHHQHHHHHQPPLLSHQHHRPPSPSPSNRSLPPFSSASSSLSEASSTGSAATGSTVTDKSLDTVSDSSGVGTSNSGGSSTGGGGTGISVHGSTTGEAVPGMTFETGTTTVVCIEDYPGTLPGHLRIVRGDVIEVTGATDCGLLEGTLHGSSGLFPTHCVQEVHLRQTAGQGLGTNRPSRVRGRRENSIKHFATAPRLKKQLPAEPRTVILHRARRGFGFVLRGAKATSPLMELTPSERCPALQYLDDVDAGGVADMAGLRKGDFLLAINDEDVSQASHEHVVDLIRRSRDLVTMTVVSGIGAGGPGGAGMAGVPGAPAGSLPGPGGCRSGSQTLPSRQYSTLPRKMTGGGARTPAPMPPRRDPKTTLSVGRARARSMVAGLSEYEATSRHGRKPSSTEEGEDGEDEDDGDDDEDEEEEEEEEEEDERKRGRRRGHRDSPATVTPTPVPTPPTLPHSTSTLLRHSAKTPPLPQSPPPIPVLPPMPRTPPPGVPKTASIRSRPTSSRITAAELEELFARQGSPVEGVNGIANRGLAQTIARGSPPTPKVYASVAEMKRSKDKGSRYRAGTEVLRMLHKAFHSTPDLMASKGQSSPGGRGAPKSRSQDDIPPAGLIHTNSTHQPRLYHHSWRSLERLGAPAMHTRSLPRRPGSSAPPPPTHPPPPPPVGQVVVVDVSQGDYANLDGSADTNVAPISPVPTGVAPAAPSITSNETSTIMSSFRPAEGAKLYASPEDVKTVAYRVPSMKGDTTVRRRGSSAATKNRSQSLPPSSTRPQVPGGSTPSEADTSVCTSFRPDSAVATPVESAAAPVGEPPRDVPLSATPLTTTPGTNPYAQPYHGSPPEGKPAEYPVETKSVRYLPTGSDGSGPPIPEPDYSLSESEEGEEGSSEEESKRAVEPQPESETVETTSSPPPVPPTMPEASTGGPSSPRLKDLLVQKVAERRGRLASNGSNGGSEKEDPPADDKNDTSDGRVQSPKASATSGGLPHSFSVEEIQKVRTQLKSSKSYPSDFLLEDGDNSSSGVSSDQDVQNEHPPPQPTVTVQPVSQPETSTLTRKTKEVSRRNSQEECKHQHQAPPQVRPAPVNSVPIQISEFEDGGSERPTVVIEGTKSSRSSEGGSRRREEGGRRTGGTLTKNAVSLVKLPPPMETDAEGDIGSPVANATMVPVAAPIATRPAPSATLSGPHRSSERSIEESLRLIKRHADMLNLTDFSRVVPPPPEFGGNAGLGGGRGSSARAEDDFAVLAPPPEFCDTSVDGHRTTIRVVGRKSGARSDGEGTQKVYVTKVKAKNIHHQQAQQEGRVTTVRIVGSVPKNSGPGNMNAERVCAVGENTSSCVTGHHGHRPK